MSVLSAPIALGRAFLGTLAGAVIGTAIGFAVWGATFTSIFLLSTAFGMDLDTWQGFFNWWLVVCPCGGAGLGAVIGFKRGLIGG